MRLMTLRVALRSDARRDTESQDNQEFMYAAQDFADGHLEVTQYQRGKSEASVVVATYPKEGLERVINNG